MLANRSAHPLKADSERLDRGFFERATLRVARDLLGKTIVRRYRGRLISGVILETEAYKGPEDRASHGYDGRRTPAVEALYNEPGSLHIYFVYGMHWLLNFKSGKPGKPEGILIRSVLTESGREAEIINGPGRVTRHFKIDKSLRGEDSVKSERLWVEERGVVVPARHIMSGPRVGINYAGDYWISRPWRFTVNLKNWSSP